MDDWASTAMREGTTVYGTKTVVSYNTDATGPYILTSPPDIKVRSLADIANLDWATAPGTQ
jgi:hypothetical protein